MSNQHAAKSNTDERGEPTTEKGAEEKCLQKSETLPWTRRLFFHFEIGVKKTTSQPGSAVKRTTSEQDQPAAGIPSQQEAAAAVAQQVLAFPAGAAKPPAPALDNAAAVPGSSTSTTLLHLHASAGTTAAPLDVGGYPGPPK
jgi:hypothetical protein